MARGWRPQSRGSAFSSSLHHSGLPCALTPSQGLLGSCMCQVSPSEKVRKLLSKQHCPLHGPKFWGRAGEQSPNLLLLCVWGSPGRLPVGTALNWKIPAVF